MDGLLKHDLSKLLHHLVAPAPHNPAVNALRGSASSASAPASAKSSVSADMMAKVLMLVRALTKEGGIAIQFSVTKCLLLY